MRIRFRGGAREGFPVVETEEPVRVRALFLSDIHLGTKGCQAPLLLDFLRRYDADLIYLVGDIIDGWRLKSGWYWPQSHNDVVQKLLRKVRKGSRLIYIPGNHDEFLRDYIGTSFGGVELAEHAIHESADGGRYLVIHGDQFDLVVRHARWLAFLGDGAYSLALFVNTHLNKVRRRLGLTYWSLSAWAKLRVKNAVNFISSFEELLSGEARRYAADGVICGHIHHAAAHDDSASRTSTPATGSNPARRWSSITTAHSNSSAGRKRQVHRASSRSGSNSGSPPDAPSHRDGCVASADQRRRSISRAHGGGSSAFGAEVSFLTPDGFRSVPMPGYGEIRLALAGTRKVARPFEAFGPTHVHIATEGPIGLAARRLCLREGGRSPRAITPASRNTSRRGCRSRKSGPTGCCGASTMRAAP